MRYKDGLVSLKETEISCPRLESNHNKPTSRPQQSLHPDYAVPASCMVVTNISEGTFLFFRLEAENGETKDSSEMLVPTYLPKYTTSLPRIPYSAYLV